MFVYLSRARYIMENGGSQPSGLSSLDPWQCPPNVQCGLGHQWQQQQQTSEGQGDPDALAHSCQGKTSGSGWLEPTSTMATHATSQWHDREASSGEDEDMDIPDG